MLSLRYNHHDQHRPPSNNISHIPLLAMLWHHSSLHLTYIHLTSLLIGCAPHLPPPPLHLTN